jgi:hypothetical protein
MDESVQVGMAQVRLKEAGVNKRERAASTSEEIHGQHSNTAMRAKSVRLAGLFSQME